MIKTVNHRRPDLPVVIYLNSRPGWVDPLAMAPHQRVRSKRNDGFRYNKRVVIPVQDWLEMKRHSKRHTMRWRVYIKYGMKCWYCGLVGTLMVQWRELADKAMHYDLAGYDSEGRLILFTLDHYWVPKSRGGKYNIKNLRPMCTTCNTTKRAAIVLER